MTMKKVVLRHIWDESNEYPLGSIYIFASAKVAREFLKLRWVEYQKFCFSEIDGYQMRRFPGLPKPELDKVKPIYFDGDLSWEVTYLPVHTDADALHKQFPLSDDTPRVVEQVEMIGTGGVSSIADIQLPEGVTVADVLATSSIKPKPTND